MAGSSTRVRSWGVVLRSAPVRVRTTARQRDRLYGLLAAAGDVWAWVLDANRFLSERGMRWVTDYPSLCRELTIQRVATFGDLGTTGARSVLRRYADACRHASEARRRGDMSVRNPRRKRRLMPVRWFHRTFTIVNARHVRVGVARGAAPVVIRLARDLPYPVEQVRSVELAHRDGALWLTVTAEVPVEHHDLDPDRVAGVDLGVIHPYAVAGPDGDALLVSGRAVRAEHRLHLADTKARQRHMSAKQSPRRAGPGTPARAGSRRWKKLRARQRKAEATHRRRVRQAHHEAANEVVAWAVDERVGTLVVGDPKGIGERDVGAVQNKRLRDWSRTHLMGSLVDEAERHGISVVKVDERGTSSTCPDCRARVPKPRGRNFSCPHCGHHGHRDLVGARNIAHLVGGTTRPTTVVKHRRAGTPSARRDRRRHLWDQTRTRRRVLPGIGPPTNKWESHAESVNQTTPPKRANVA